MSVPENTKLSIVQLSLRISLYSFVYTKILMIPCKNLYSMSARMIVQYEVFKQVYEVLLLADTSQHCFKLNTALIVFCKSFPFMEELILAFESSYLSLHTV